MKAELLGACVRRCGSLAAAGALVVLGAAAGCSGIRSGEEETPARRGEAEAEVSWEAGNFRYLPSMRGDLESLVAGLAHPNDGDYEPVGSSRQTRFNEFLEALFGAIDDSLAAGATGDWCDVTTKASAAGYSIHRLHDTVTGRWFIFAEDATRAGQAYLLINPHAKRDIVIEVPHAGYELDVDLQGVKMLKDLAARVLIVNKEHRCSDPDATPCTGSAGRTCDGYYRESDVAHHVENTFHLLHRHLSDRSRRTRFVQIHGMIGSPIDMVEASDSTTTDVNPRSVSVKFIEHLRSYVPDRRAVASCQEAEGEPGGGLCASSNVQGRYTNAPSADACSAVTSTSHGRFLHLEQHRSLRDDDERDGYSWRDVSRALRDTWPDCDMTGDSTDCSLGPAQHEQSGLTCPTP